ncbi:hypothetical protein C480_16490 [Natrialba aegyptia DSM 13077]|uniref:Oligosaccharide repeat unit polymerase n=2 Tax=Natrialba aegyptia TaxID=129789 RepID=M0B0X0_9EURY|nr:hypothetical protein C480_16490 [Natrialba aegyptia DSM 13077]
MITIILFGSVIGVTFFFLGFQGTLLSILFILCFVPVIVSLQRGSFDLLEPIIVYTAFMLMFAIAIFDRVYLQDPFLRYSEVVSTDFSTAFLLITTLYVIFFALVLVGYYIDISRFIAIPQIYPTNVQHNSNILRKMGYLYMFLGSVFYLVLVSSALGGNLFLLFTSTRPRSSIFAGSYHLQLGAQLLHLGYTVWFVSILADNKKPKIRHLVPVGPIVVAFFLLGGRGSALGIIVNFIVLIYYSTIYGLLDIKTSGLTFVQDKFHQWVKTLTIPIAGAVIAVTVLLTGSLRRNRTITEAIVNMDLVRLLTAGIHNDTLDSLIATLEVVPEQFGFYWGTFVFRVPLNWIPRSIWSEKPVLTVGSKFRRVILPNQSGGRPPGEIGRFYVDLGYPGIVIGALVTGLVLRYLYELLRKNGHSPMFLFIYSTSLFLISMNGLTNNVLWNSMSSMILLLPIIFLDGIYWK